MSRIVRPVFAILLMLALSTSTTALPAGAQPTSPVRIAGGASTQLEDAPRSQPTRDKHPKMDSQLAAAARIMRESGEVAALHEADARGLVVRDGRVRVIIDAVDPAAVRMLVVQTRGEIEVEYANSIQALVPVPALEILAASPNVRYIAVPARPVPDGVPGEEILASNATAWQAAGITGIGVKVAVIDGGFNGYQARQASGDLPISLVTRSFGCASFTAGDGHGTAVAEIVYEMAPGVALYLLCVDTQLNLAQAKDFAKAEGITVISHSVSWFNSSRGDGSGGPATPNGIVADAVANGILWVNSAGNRALQHWSGTFTDTDGDDIHNFTPTDEGNTIFLSQGAGTCMYLRWDDWPASSQDYDLILRRSSNLAVVAASVGFQNGTQTPTEFICYQNTDPGQNFAIFIERFSATTTPSFDLFIIPGPNLEYSVTARSVTEPGSSPSTFAAGAVCWQNSALENFSSQGPTIDMRTKPDIAGQDSQSSATYGNFSGCGTTGFAGTSASTPTVAGAAALVKQANPAFTPAQIRSFLTSRAIDQGTPGADNQFGAGRLNLGSPPATTGGHGFNLEVTPGEAIHARWNTGTVQTGYQALRIDVLTGLLSNFGLLGTGVTGFDDASPSPIACYVDLVLGGLPANSITLGQTDGLCVFMGVASGNVPPHFTIQLNETLTSTLRWGEPPGGASAGYTLVVIPVDGNSPIDFQQVPAGTTLKTHNTGGRITCYQVLVNGPGDNKTNATCAFPGGATLTATGAATSLSTAMNRVRDTVNLPSVSGPRSSVQDRIR